MKREKLKKQLVFSSNGQFVYKLNKVYNTLYISKIDVYRKAVSAATTRKHELHQHFLCLVHKQLNIARSQACGLTNSRHLTVILSSFTASS